MLGHQMIRALAIALLVLCAGTARAQEGAAFLKIGVGARAIGMGNAYTATADDADSMFWNPAGLAQMKRPALGASRAMMFLGDAYDSISVGVPLGTVLSERETRLRTKRGGTNGFVSGLRQFNRGVLGLGVTRLSQTPQEGRDANRRRTGDFDSSDMAISLGYARPLTNRLHFGAAIKRVESRIADAKADTVALDLGGTYFLRGTRGWRLGGAVRNLGRGLKFSQERSELPLTLAGGVAVQAFRGMLVSAEVQIRPHSNKTSFSVGTEYALLPSILLRAGFQQKGGSAPSSSDASPFSALGGGFGFRFGRFNLDYSLTPFGELGSVQRFSLGLRF
jgi:hypothetical protein